jgi:sugar phosphate isomerase/epimerase
VQLYTLRAAVAEDLDAVLGSLAEIGYSEVELFQLHGLTPSEMKARLDAAGLRAASSHYDLALLRDDLDRHIDGAREIGQELMVVPWLDEPDRTAEGLARVAEDFNRIGAAVRDAGMRLGYHNHDFEFVAVPGAGGDTIMDVLLERTDPDLVDWQMDIYWTVHGGVDVPAQLSAHAGRITSVHVKDRTPGGDMVDVGDGVLDFADLIPAAVAQGLRHAFVEHDNPTDALESVRKAYAHLRSIGVVA